MANEVSICNQALSWLGTKQIASLTEGSANANLCLANYYEARDATLESAEWTFATERIRFWGAVDTPIFGYSVAFDISAHTPKILRVLECRDNANVANGVSDLDWRKEGSSILCDASEIWVKAIVAIEGPTIMSTLFRQALAARLAAMLSPTITESNSKTEAMWALYGNYEKIASATDAQQGKSSRIRGRSLTSRVR